MVSDVGSAPKPSVTKRPKEGVAVSVPMTPGREPSRERSQGPIGTQMNDPGFGAEEPGGVAAPPCAPFTERVTHILIPTQRSLRMVECQFAHLSMGMIMLACSVILKIPNDALNDHTPLPAGV